MGDIGRDAGGAILEQGLGSIAERAAGIDDIVDQDAVLAADVADDVHDFGFARPVATLVDDGEQTVEALGERAGADHATDVRRNDHDVLEFVVFLDVARQDRHGVKVIGRDIEEALDLAGVKIERQDAVGAGLGDQVGDQLGRDRRARAGLAVLAGIAEIGNHGSDAARRRTTERVDHDQQFHQVVVRRERGRLDDENVLAAHVFLDFDEDFLIGEPSDAGLAQGNIKMFADRFGKMPVRIACENLHFGPPRVSVLLGAY